MKIRAQIGKVLNLDKCIGCHTCSVTCKNVWTSRQGMEYAWFNNVETKPGLGYPRRWEDQNTWNGGWKRKENGEIVPKMGGKLRIWPNSSPIRTCRKSTIITSRSPLNTRLCKKPLNRRPCRRRARIRRSPAKKWKNPNGGQIGRKFSVVNSKNAVRIITSRILKPIFTGSSRTPS